MVPVHSFPPLEVKSPLNNFCSAWRLLLRFLRVPGLGHEGDGGAARLPGVGAGPASGLGGLQVPQASCFTKCRSGSDLLAAADFASKCHGNLP